MSNRRIRRSLLTFGVLFLHLWFSQPKPSAAPDRLADTTNHPENRECKLLDVNGNKLVSPPADGSVIFSATIFGEKRVGNVIHMLKDLLVARNDESGADDKTDLSPRQVAMIAVSGNKTLVPLLMGLSEAFSPMETRVFVANLERDFGPISRVAAADLCFSPLKNYTIVVGDDDVIYNPQAVFFELPDYLRRVQQRLTNNSAAMVGYNGMHWVYPFVQWGPFVKGGTFRHHISDEKWKAQRDAAPSKACMNPHESGLNLKADTSKLCKDIIPTGLLECYGLIAFQRSVLNPRLYEKHLHPDFLATCFWGDDFWLSYFAFRMSIPRFLVRSRVTNPSSSLIRKLPQPDGSVGSKSGPGMSNLANYRKCERAIYKKQGNCSWCIPNRNISLSV